MDGDAYDMIGLPPPLGRLNFPPTPRPRSRHNAGRQQHRRPYLLTQRRLLLDWPEENDFVVDLSERQDQESEDNWTNRVGNLLLGGDENEMSDVSFVLYEEVPGEEVREVSLKAHKFILSLRSPVFHAMFFGPMAESSSEIAVPDVSLSAFKAMLNFIYKDSVSLQTLQGAWQLWYVSRKYMIEALEERCRKFLKSHLTPMNVLDTYAFAEQYGDPQVLYQCLRLIDYHAKFILTSPSFVYLPLHHAKAIISRKTLNIKEIELFQSVISWIQAEIERRIHDDDEGNVQGLKEVFLAEFVDLIQFKEMSSQEFVHSVLPQNVLETETIANVAACIRSKEMEKEVAKKLTESVKIGSLNESPSSKGPGKAIAESKLGLNQAREILFEQSTSSRSTCSNSFLRTGVVHTEADIDPSLRYGPGYYQLSRFSPAHELALVWKWPREYSLRFRANKNIYLLGACITETDRQFYSPKVKYFLKLKDSTGKTLSDGSETFIKKTTSKFEGGVPKTLDYGPHDVSFRNVAYVYKDKWYELNLKISEEMWSVCPLLVCKCQNAIENFGVHFDFEPSYEFSRKGNNLESFKRDISETESGGGEESSLQDANSGLAYGLISRLYFFY